MMIKLLIDAGHAINTIGKRSPEYNGKVTKEHAFNTKVAYYLEEELKRCNVFKIYRSGYNGKNAYNDFYDAPLSERQKIAKANKCEYSISIHANAHGNGKDFTSASGFEVFIHDKYPNKSNGLAKTVLAELSKGTKQKNRGVKKNGFAMCNTSTMATKASILIELAFMTNEYELELIRNVSFQKECAKEIAVGICKYLKVRYVQEPVNPDKKKLYKCQVGAFKNKENAEELKKTLKKEVGVDAFIVKYKDYYKVQVGAFKIKQNALNLQARIKAYLFDCFIVEEEQE